MLANEPPPRIDVPAGKDRNYTLLGQALLIRPGAQTTYLRFSNGVSRQGPDFTLSADIVELDLASSEMPSAKEFKLPQDQGRRGARGAGPGPGDFRDGARAEDPRCTLLRQLAQARGRGG